MTTNPTSHHRHSIRLKEYDYAEAGAYFITLCTNNLQPIFGKIVGAGLAPAQMELNEFGQIALEQWQQIPTRFDQIELDAFVVMPNHIHGILLINESAVYQNGEPQCGQPQGLPLRGANDTAQPVGAGFTPAQDVEINNAGVGASHRVGASPTPTIMKTGQPPTGQPQGLPLRVALGNIVGAYKSLVANECLKIFKTKNELMGKIWQRNYYEHIIRDEKSYLEIAQYITDNPSNWNQDKLFSGETA